MPYCTCRVYTSVLYQSHGTDYRECLIISPQSRVWDREHNRNNYRYYITKIYDTNLYRLNQLCQENKLEQSCDKLIKSQVRLGNSIISLWLHCFKLLLRGRSSSFLAWHTDLSKPRCPSFAQKTDDNLSQHRCTQ